MLIKRRNQTGWIQVKNTNPNRPTLHNIIVNNKIIRGVGRSMKAIEIHQQNNTEFIVPVIRISLYSLENSSENIIQAMEALSILERVISFFGNEEAEKELMELVSKHDTSHLIQIPAKKKENKVEKEQTQPELPF